MTQAETYFTHAATADAVTITCHNGFPIHETLKARGYRFVTAPGATAVWSLTIPRTDVAAAKAEAMWLQAQGYNPRRA